jgi:hypothetical protein
MADGQLKEQNVSFNDQSAGYKYELTSTIDSTRTNTDANDVDLGNFFERPLKIASYEWSTTITFFETFNPWTLFLENPRVANRISNYKLLKGKLHVKFMINGNAFYYGRLLASYQPRHLSDDLTVNRALIYADNVEASQRPHIFIDPCTNQAGEITCPFLCDTDALNIPNGDWRAMGEMSLRELTQLRHANGATEPITITVMAWMSEVTLSAPTAANSAGLTAQIGFEPQSGFEFQSGKSKKNRLTKTTNMQNKNDSKLAKQDEYGSGPVSGPAATVARIAGMLEEAPIIGPYAKATQIAARGISNIAKLFGYSRPPTLAPEMKTQHRPFTGLALTNTPDETEKLSFDAKQELTVDGTVVGLDNTDEMLISSIATRESFLTTTTWETTDLVDQILFSSAVTPCQKLQYGGVPIEYHQTACSFAAVPFKYWRGSMKYRFQIVSSAYHKGRIKIQWDPVNYSSQETNIQYTQIVDISDEKDFTIEIGWGSEYAWLDCVGYTTSAHITRASYPLSSTNTFANGVLTVSVLNTLTSPSLSAGDTVALNVFVSAGDDIEFAVPTADELLTHSYFPQVGFEPQSGMENTNVIQEDKDCTDEPSKPMSQQVLTTFATAPDSTDYNADVYHGESVRSFRQLLKRYNFVGAIGIKQDALAYSNSFVMKHYPPLPNQDTNHYWDHLIGTKHNKNMNSTTLLSYLYPAFVAMRGGTRWRVQFYAGYDDMVKGCTSITLDTTSTTCGPITPEYIDLTSPFEAYAHGKFIANGDQSWNGQSVQATLNNPVAYAEIPYQTNRRFLHCRDIHKNIRDGDRPVKVNYSGSTRANGGACLAAYVSTAEDFSLHMYLSPPIFY